MCLLVRGGGGDPLAAGLDSAHFVDQCRVQVLQFSSVVGEGVGDFGMMWHFDSIMLLSAIDWVLSFRCSLDHFSTFLDVNTCGDEDEHPSLERVLRFLAVKESDCSMWVLTSLPPS
jgi:hypothetical protein